MKQVDLIVVGKLKDKNLEAIENDYFKRLKSPKLCIHECKALAENKNAEAQNVLKKISDISKEQKPYIVLLAENGKEFESHDFSNWLYQKVEAHQRLIFVIAGAEGHGEEILSLANDKLSLSKMTFPHKIARIVFIEQFYRAWTIKENHPYHN